LNVRPIERGDAEAILGIQAESPEIAQWSRASYERLAEEQMAGWVAEVNESISGFITVRQLAGDIEILNLAVRRDARRQGVGVLLLDTVASQGKESHVKKIYIEVRASNEGARKFYARHGFRETGRRPRYYSDPVEDALLLELALDCDAAPGK
jgi:ribosomal-protein-alanine acetyltransferase